MQISDLRILVIGCGSIGKRHIQVLSEIGAKNIVACDPSDEQRAAIEAEFPFVKTSEDYLKALSQENFDCAFVLTPTATHLEIIENLLNADCHVFVEKPLANSSDGIDKVSALAKEKGLKIMVGFCFRYHEVLRKAKELLDSGLIGRLVNIRALMGEPFAMIQPNYLNMYYSKYSGAFELVHDLDLAIWFSGQDIEEVYSVYGSFSDMGMRSPDSIEMLLRFRDRQAANVHLDFYQYPRRRQIELMGVKGTIIVEFSTWDKATLSYCTMDDGEWHAETYATQRNDMFRDENLEFLNAVTGDGEIVCTVDEALKSLRVIEQIYDYKKDMNA